MEQGLIHIYCGDGKGKTTAAVGLAVRAAGAGMRVLFAQFMKSGGSSELAVLKNIKNIEISVIKNSYGFTWNMTDDDRIRLKSENDMAVAALIEAVRKEKCQMLVLDEIVSAYQGGLVAKEPMLELMHLCKGKTELVLTGRSPADELMGMADYITQMKCERHPYERGIGARMGIEL